MRKLLLFAAVVGSLGLTLPGAAPADSVTNMTNHGGRVMTTSTTYAIFWLPAGVHYEPASGNAATDTANDNRYMNLLIRYFQDVGGSDIYETATQYPGSNGALTNSSTYGGSVVRTTAYPSAGTAADPLTNAELSAEVEAARVAQGWPTGVGAVYFIYTGYGIQSCFNASSCSRVNYCAYHTWYTSGSDRVIWANMPDARSLNDPGGSVCDSFSPNGDAYADVEVNVTSHEHLEAVTDPELDAWSDDVDGLGGENADKCAYTYGVVNSVDANIYMNGNPYRLQTEWSNAVTGCAMSYSTASPFINQPTLTFTSNIVQPAIAGNPGDTVTYNLSVTNPSNAEPARNVVITTTLPPGLVRTGGSSLTINVGDIGVHDTENFTINLTPSGELLDGTSHTVSSSVAYKDSLFNARPAANDSDSVSVVNVQPALVLPPDQSQDYHDPLTFGISATDANAGDTLTLTASGLPAGLSFTDNGNRTGTVSGQPEVPAGNYVVTFFAADGHHLSPVSDTLVIHVLHEETTLDYTGATVIANGFNATMVGLLREDGVTPIAGRTVSFTLGSQGCSGTTNGAGIASCTIPVSSALGSVPITAAFAGDAFYLPSGDSATALVFQFLARGSFVLGDNTVAAATPTTSVNWWGSNWNVANSLSGGAPPGSFKGFAGAIAPGPPAAPACGSTWTATPGNSASPASPAAIPEYMGTLVSSNVTKSGSTISGNIAKIVVVRTASGYDSSPGHPGTGTIVGTFC